jgi:hypothetical protein
LRVFTGKIDGKRSIKGVFGLMVNTFRLRENLNQDCHRQAKVFFLFAAIIVITVFALLACTNPANLSSEQHITGSITGKAVFTNSENHSDITITLEQTDGLRSTAVINTGRSLAEGISGVRVISSMRSVTATTKTAVDGSYTIRDVPAGTYTLYASSHNSLEKAVAIDINVRSNEVFDAGTLNLTPVGSISGKITVDGNSAMGFLVSVAGTSFMAVTDGDGTFTINGVPAENSYMIIVMKGYYTAFYTSDPVSVSGGATTNMETKNITSQELLAGSDITIGENGNWYINGVDTGIPAQGQQGEKGDTGADGSDGKDGNDGKDGVIPALAGIEIFKHPSQYLMGEQPNLIHDLSVWQVANVYDDGTRIPTMNYTATVAGNTFTAGRAVTITVTSSMDAAIKTSVNIPVSNTLIDTGLPVVYIDTQDAQGITSKETYVNMDMRIVADNPAHGLTRAGFRDEIRGRGNSSWYYPKKPYRIRFAEKTALFGLEAARNWVLLANWKDYTLLSNTIALELGHRFGMPYTNHYIHVEVVLNGAYQGSYVLTEHIQVHEGRVEIDSKDGYLVELDVNYDDEPKFRTTNLQLPAMILSPETNYDFVIDSLNEFDDAVSAAHFPNNNYADLTDLDSLVDFLLINEIVRNGELGHPKSTYLYRDKGEKIKWGPLWDFDWAYGFGGNQSVSLSNTRSRFMGGGFFSRFHNDPEFQAKYHARWNEKIGDIASMSTFISEMQNKLSISAELNARRWYSSSYDYNYEVGKLKTWWNERVPYLNEEINKHQPPQTQRLMILQIGASADDSNNVSHTFVELYNNTSQAITLTGVYSLQYAEGTKIASGATEDSGWTKINLTGTIQPYHSFLILGAKRSTSNTPGLKIEDNSGDMNETGFKLSNRAGKVVLMENQILLDVQKPFTGNGDQPVNDYVDMIGYFNDNTDQIFGFETQPIGDITKQAGARRVNLEDTDDNSVDFEKVAYNNNSTDVALKRPKNLAYGAWNPITGVKE